MKKTLDAKNKIKYIPTNYLVIQAGKILIFLKSFTVLICLYILYQSNSTLLSVHLKRQLKKLHTHMIVTLKIIIIKLIFIKYLSYDGFNSIDYIYISFVVLSQDQKTATTMFRLQSKLQELTLEQMKDVLLKAHPELAYQISSLSERQVRHKYYSFVQQKRSRKEKGGIINLQTAQFGHSDKESSITQIKIRNKKVDEQSIKPESIRDSIIKNLPEMKDMIRTLSNQELYQLYFEFRQKNKSAFKAKSVILTSMIAQVLQAYPSIRDRIDECNEGDIERLYNTIKDTRNSFGKSGTQGAPISIDEQTQAHNVSWRGQFEERTDNLDKMRSQMRSNVPLQAELIDQLQDIDVEMLNSEPRKNTQIAERCQGNIQRNLSQNNNVIPCLPEIYSREHPYSHQQPRARTYLMVHTQYEGVGQQQKMLNLQSSSQRCQCSCCQNNTIHNMFSQLINTINSQR